MKAYDSNKLETIIEQEIKFQNHRLSTEVFWEYLSQFALSDANDKTRRELKNYLNEDFRRFCYTFSILPNIDRSYDVFEIGSNPYYLTALLKEYTNYRVDCSNCFNDMDSSLYCGEQELVNEAGTKLIRIPFINLNIEKNWYQKNTGGGYDVVCFCEVIEHMIESPIKALLNINCMLKRDGYLVMSTPNVNRLENVAKMIAGANIYDPYSGYGQYGRHNREYNKHELAQMLNLCGFQIEIMFSSNVHTEYGKHYFDIGSIMALVQTIPYRDLDLGQYIFIRAKKIGNVESVEAPEWLYRSLSEPIIRIGKRVQE